MFLHTVPCHMKGVHTGITSKRNYVKNHHIVAKRACLNKYKCINIISLILTHYNAVKLENNGKGNNINCKYMAPKHKWIIEESKEETNVSRLQYRCHYNIKWTVIQVKAVLNAKFISSNIHSIETEQALITKWCSSNK